jgi:hypothetical protein
MTLAEVTDIAEQNRKAIAQSLASASTSSSSAPTLIQALTSVDGSQVLLYFNTPMSSVFPAAPAGFTVTLNTVADVVTAVALGANLTCIALTLTTPSRSASDTLTVVYTAGTVQSAAGQALASFTATSVSNALAPYVECGSAAWNSAGIQFNLEYLYTDRPSPVLVYGEDGGQYSLVWTITGGNYDYATVTPLNTTTPSGSPYVNFLAVCTGMIER